MCLQDGRFNANWRSLQQGEAQHITLAFSRVCKLNYPLHMQYVFCYQHESAKYREGSDRLDIVGCIGVYRGMIAEQIECRACKFDLSIPKGCHYKRNFSAALTSFKGRARSVRKVECARARCSCESCRRPGPHVLRIYELQVAQGSCNAHRAVTDGLSSRVC